MTKRLILTSVGAAVIAACSTGANASMVTNGDFDGTIAAANYQTVNSFDNTTIPGWTVSAGSVEWINNYWFGSSLLPGDHSIDLSGNSQGTIQQSITGLVLNQWYKLTFDVALNPDRAPPSQTLNFSLGTALEGIVGSATGTTNPKNSSWTPYAFSFQWLGLSDTALLVFASTVPSATNCCFGPALDNVELNAVPLPAALPLFAAGLGAMGYFGSRRRRKAALAA